MPQIHKRTAAVLMAMSFALVAAGCSSQAPSDGTASGSCTPSTSKVTTIDYWSWLPSATQVVDKFNATHPKIHVKLQKIAGGAPAYQTMFNALKAGNQPDVAMVEFDHLPNFRAQNGLTDISKCAPVKDLKKKVVGWTYNQVSLGGDALYATPTDTGPLALYYRTDIFKQYGLTMPTTWDQYMQDAETLHAKNPAISITSFTPQDAVMLQGLDWQAGAKPYVYNGDKFELDMNSAAVDKVSDYWQTMIDKKLVNTSIQPLTPAQYKAWDDGTIASTIGAVWLQGIQTSSSTASAGKWAVAPLPAWTAGQPAGANYGGATTAVLSGTKHPYEDAVFADWLSTDPAASKIVFAGGGTGASLAYAKSGALDMKVPYYGNQEIFHVFQDGADTTDTSFQWAPDQTNLNNYLQDALAGAFTGTTTISEAYSAAQTKAAADLKSQSIPVTVK